MLPVGIHKKLVLVKAERDERGTLVIGVRQSEGVDPLAFLSGIATGSLDKQGQDIKLFPIKVEINDQKRSSKDILGDIADFRDQLTQILEQYMTSDKIKLNATFGMPDLTQENFNTRIQTQEIVDKMYNNLVEQFITQITPFLGENGKKCNWKFVRQSKAKHYPTLPKKYLSTYPFIEDSSVPVSKLKYSNYEIEKGLNVPDALTGQQVVPKDEAERANALFAK